jgi:hypothetical protein
VIGWISNSGQNRPEAPTEVLCDNLLNNCNLSMNCKEMCVLYAVLNWMRYGFAHIQHLVYSFRITVGEERERYMRVISCCWLMRIYS